MWNFFKLILIYFSSALLSLNQTKSLSPVDAFVESGEPKAATKDVLKNFAKFTGKHLCQCLFFKEVAGFRPVTLLKKRLWRRCFPVNFANFVGALFLQNATGRLPLQSLSLEISLMHVLDEMKSLGKKSTAWCLLSRVCCSLIFCCV